MYEINLKEKRTESKFFYTTKNINNQILTLNIIKDYTHKSINYYIIFFIGKKKKGYEFLNTTGKDGIKSLIWAKNCIKDFIIQIKEHYEFNLYENHSIVINWDDNRRRDIYYHGLKSLKFYYGMKFGIKSLIYNIK